jgi:SAM-dependent methyltransferase
MRAACRSPAARSYDCLADVYDQCVGWGSFRSIRRAFETLQRRYGITFRSAADLGCGTGLFACYLHDVWRVPVYAVDISPAMILRARRNCSRPGIAFLLQDIRDLRLPQPVDLITAHFDTLNHIVRPAELRATLNRLYQNLRPGGHLLFDLVTDGLIRAAPDRVTTHFRVTGGSVTRHMLVNPARRLFLIRVVRRWEGDARPVIRRHLERAYTIPEVVHWLRQGGFRVRAVLDALTLRDPRPASMRMAIIARRAIGSV